MDGTLRLLCVFAHPDDESLGTGATIARYRAEGIETHLVTATRGERGWFGTEDENPGLDALGRMREAELMQAARVLGLSSVSFLDYIDGDLDQAPAVEIIDKIAGHIRRVKPHVVITFGPEGVYGHPDHIAISQFTGAATVRAASPAFHDPDSHGPHEVSKLYYMVATADHIKQYEEVFGELVMNIDGVRRQGVGWKEWAVTTWVDTAAYWQTARDAITCHRTQLPGYDALLSLPPERLQSLWTYSPFYRAFSTVNGGRSRETDLFEGLR